MEQQTRVIYHHDEIDLRQLFFTLWQQKRLILLITSVSILIGLAYIYFKKPVYEIKVSIAQPYETGIDSLAYKILPLTDIVIEPSFLNVQKVYEIFIRTLLTESAKFNINAPNNSPINFLTVKEIPRSQSHYILTARGQDPNELADGVNQYINLIKANATNQLMHVMDQYQQDVLQLLQLKINNAKNITKKIKLDRLVKLKEALKIAQTVGANEHIPLSTGEIIVNGYQSEDPGIMYSRGSKALIAEIENLKHRKSEEPFTPGLRELQNEYDFLKKNKIRVDEHTQMFHLEDDIVPPDFQAAPKKSMIIVLSVILGLMCGIIIAIIRNYFNLSPHFKSEEKLLSQQMAGVS